MRPTSLSIRSEAHNETEAARQLEHSMPTHLISFFHTLAVLLKLAATALLQCAHGLRCIKAWARTEKCLRCISMEVTVKESPNYVHKHYTLNHIYGHTHDHAHQNMTSYAFKKLNKMVKLLPNWDGH